MSRKVNRGIRRSGSALVEKLEERRLFALLGVGLEFPLTAMVNADRGALTYSAATGQLSATATPVGFLLNPTAIPVPVFPPATSELQFFLNPAGSVTGGVSSHDFTLTGEVDADDDGIIDYSGLLLTGEVVAFGFQEAGNTDFYDLRLTATGGALFNDFFVGKDIGLTIVSEASTFAGSFAVDFTGQIKANVAPIEKLKPRLGTIEGRKFLDVTGNSLSADDRPLGGVTIELYRDVDGNGLLTSADGAAIATDVTDAGTGLFSFGGLEPGRYLVREIVPAGFLRTFPLLRDFHAVDLAAGATAAALDFANVQKNCCRDMLESFHFLINNQTQVSNLRGNTNAGDTVTVVFTIRQGVEPVELTLVSYTAPTRDFRASNANEQRIFDLQTGFFGPGTHTMTVLNPVGFYQVDFICGPAIDILGPAGSNVFYTPQGRLLSADNDGPKLPVPNRTALSGFVWADSNDNGVFNDDEDGISNVTITLTGTDDTGATVTRVTTTDAFGRYVFGNLVPGTYTITQTQPASFQDGRDSLGSNGGTLGNDVFSNIRVDVGNAGTQYNFGEIGTRVVHADPLGEGMTATIGFWRNRNGQALIRALNGSETSRQLGNWLATTFPNLYGANSIHSTAGRTNAEVAALYRSVFANRKIEAQAFAVALAIYATDRELAGGNFASSFGFIVSSQGTGAAVINVGSVGSRLGFANGSNQTIFHILRAVDARTGSNGIISGNHSVRSAINSLLTRINEGGDRDDD